MGKEKIKKLFLVGFGILFGLLTFIQDASAMYTGQALVDRAKAYLGISYKKGQPPEKSDGYGWVFTEWDRKSIDCSGLVDVAADLRRHYGCQYHLMGPLSTSIKWEDLEAGDLIIKYDHVRIFMEWEAKDTTKPVEKWKPKVIEATPLTVTDKKTYVISDLQNAGYTPRRLKPDEIKPTITVKGIKDGEVYNKPATVTFEATDNVYTRPI